MPASDGGTPGSRPRRPASASCHDTLAELWSFLDHECRSARRERLRDHLASCASCRDTYRIAGRFKELLASRCRGECASDSLRARVLGGIQPGAVPTRPTGGHVVVERDPGPGRSPPASIPGSCRSPRSASDGGEPAPVSDYRVWDSGR